MGRRIALVMRCVVKFKVAVVMVLALAGLGLLANSSFAVLYAPTGLDKEVGRIISRDAAHEFVGLFEQYPQINGHTIIDDEGNTLLHRLATTGQNEMIALMHFLGKGKRTVSIKNSKGETPIDAAGGFTSTRRLLEAMGDDTKGIQPITAAARRGDKESVEVLVKALTWKVYSNHGSVRRRQQMGNQQVQMAH